MIAEVIVDVLSSNVDKVFDYNIPPNLNAVVGDRVVVPFGSRNIDGFVINIKQTSSYDKSKLKDIISKKDPQPLSTTAKGGNIITNKTLIKDITKYYFFWNL